MAAALNVEDGETRIFAVVYGVRVPVFDSLGELRQWASEHPEAKFAQITYVSGDNSGVESYEGGGPSATVEDDGRQVRVVVTGGIEPLGVLIAALNIRAVALGRELIVAEDTRELDGDIHRAGLTVEGLDEHREVPRRDERGYEEDGRDG